MEWLRGLIRTPHFGDPEKDRIAAVLHPILLTVLGVVALLIPTAFRAEVAANKTPVIITDVALILAALPPLWLMRRDYR